MASITFSAMDTAQLPSRSPAELGLSFQLSLVTECGRQVFFHLSSSPRLRNVLKSNLGDVRLQPKLIGTFVVMDPSVLRFKWKKNIIFDRKG